MNKCVMMISVMCMAGAIASAQDRPNIVWLTTEDNSANWYRLYNPNGAAMPNVERLAKEGLVFNHAYSCGAVCSVSRSTIISGIYAPRTGTQYHRKKVPVSMPDGMKLFPFYLREAGYYTANNYKQDYNYTKLDKQGVWDESSEVATYRNREPGQPFFYVQNFHTTHESRMHPNPNVGYDSKTETPEDSVEIFPYHPDTPTFRHAYARYLDLNTQVDAEMGVVINQLEADGLLDDTFIFHYGDHGGVLPGSKGYAHNDGLQVAMVVYVPKNWQHLVPAKRGSRIDGFVEFVDLSATVLNLAGVTIPDGIDGKPFLGKGVALQELNQRDTAFGYADRFDEKYDMVRFLRKGKYSYWRSYQPFNFDGLYNVYRYKQTAYMEWRDLAKEGVLNADQQAFYEPRDPEQLYDLSTDPHEINNLADDPAYADVLIDMRHRLQAREKSMPDVGFYPESQFIRDSQSNGAEFGQKQKARIAELIDIADLQLQPFPEVRPRIQRAIRSEESMERYWGLITCSAFGKQALALGDEIKKIAESDPDLLVRVRAAEFLGLTGAGDPLPVLIDALEKSTDRFEADIIFNTVVLLRDGAGMEFDVSKMDQLNWAQLKKRAPQRVKYLNTAKNEETFPVNGSQKVE